MRRSRAALLGALTALTALAAAPAGAAAATISAKQRVIVGMGDQKPGMFADSRFSALGLKRARYIVGWDVIQNNDIELERLDAWLAQARAHGVEPLITFNHSRVRHDYLPTPAEYDQAVAAFRARYPWITVFGAWNEANHKLQPTYKRPDAAAGFYEILMRRCAGCQVLAADVLDDGNVVRWITSFRKATRLKPRLWGLHAYGDAQKPKRYLSQSRTARFLRAAPGQVWLTETGGFVYFRTLSGVTAYPFDEVRAARAVAETFKVAKFSPRIDRLYLYMWQADTSADARWDSAFIGPDGRARPSYETLRRELGRLHRPNKLHKPRVKKAGPAVRRGRAIVMKFRLNAAASGRFTATGRAAKRTRLRVITKRKANSSRVTVTLRPRRKGSGRVALRFVGREGWASQQLKSVRVR